MHTSNFLSASKHFIQAHTKKRVAIVTICAIVFCFVLAFSVHRAVTNAYLANTAQAKAASQKALEASRLKAAKALASDTAGQADARSSTPTGTSRTTSPATRYSTSFDPRSTDYSLTPPTPPAGDFSIAITHAGQVAAGTQIGLNSIKHLSAYYGGDLLLSPGTLTISKSSGVLSANTTVSIPDGVTSNFPAQAWNDPNHSILFVSTNSSPTAGTSWAIHVNTIGSSMASGTYTVHLTAFRTGSSDTSWQYDGFITVNIVD
jgi:hypothetical protein